MAPVDVVEGESRDVDRAQTEMRQAQRHRVVATPDRGRAIERAQERGELLVVEDLR
jgi:hypothetical protein